MKRRGERVNGGVAPGRACKRATAGRPYRFLPIRGGFAGPGPPSRQGAPHATSGVGATGGRPSFALPSLFSALVVATLAASAPSAAADAPKDAWPSFRGDARLSGVAGSTLPDALAPLWTYTSEAGFEATPAIAGGTVYVASLDGRLHALALADGALRWTYAAGTPENPPEIKSSPLVADGTVYFGDENGTLHAVDAATGKGRWKFTAEGAFTSSPNLAGAGSTACLLAGSYDNSLYCLRPADGALRWKLETEGYVHASPAVDGDRVVVTGCDGFLRVVGLADGKERAKVALGGYTASSPALDRGIAFAGTFENEVRAVDLGTGATRWTFRDPERNFPFYASVALAGDAVIAAGRDKIVRALDRETGAQRWSFATRARLDASPVVAGDRVAVAAGTGELFLLDRASGEARWSYDGGSPFSAGPAIADGRLVSASADGTVTCFGPPREGTR